jgi:hypothetical protein
VLFGSTLAAAARYAFGTWLPSVAQLVRNPLTLAYLVLSSLAGLALTYYFNDVSNHKARGGVAGLWWCMGCWGASARTRHSRDVGGEHVHATHPSPALLSCR